MDRCCSQTAQDVLKLSPAGNGGQDRNCSTERVLYILKKRPKMNLHRILPLLLQESIISLVLRLNLQKKTKLNQARIFGRSSLIVHDSTDPTVFDRTNVVLSAWELDQANCFQSLGVDPFTNCGFLLKKGPLCAQLMRGKYSCLADILVEIIRHPLLVCLCFQPVALSLSEAWRQR